MKYKCDDHSLARRVYVCDMYSENLALNELEWPPSLLISKNFSDAMEEGQSFLQTLLRPDVNIPYENPQWHKVDESDVFSPQKERATWERS